MKQVQDGVWKINDYNFLVDSPDDGGYYIEQWHSNNTKTRTSQVFSSKQEALSAFRKDEVKWGDWN